MSILMDGNNDEGVMNDINMTPLIDVMLVLLIIFIVTLPVINKAVKVDLPKAAAQPAESKSQDIDLSITADKTVLWNKAVVDDAALKLRVEAAARQGEPPAVNINADQHVEYGKVAAVLAALQGGGLNKINFVMQPRRTRNDHESGIPGRPRGGSGSQAPLSHRLEADPAVLGHQGGRAVGADARLRARRGLGQYLYRDLAQSLDRHIL